jgi:hypothetical protein
MYAEVHHAARDQGLSNHNETSHQSSNVVFTLDFSDYPGGPVDEWLQAKGLKFEESARDRDSLKLTITDGALGLEAKEAMRGLLVKEELDLTRFSKVRIEWGVARYPEGASYANAIRNQAIMVFIFFGKERISSGHLLYPNLPYFVGVYLCDNDQLHTPYTGNSYQAGGRYVCVGNPPPETTITSEFDLVTAFQTYFAKDDIPPISGLALEVDTRSSGNGGTAAAFIKRITILD